MPDLLTHLLLAYAAGTALSMRYRWLAPHWVSVVMAGALLPDLDHVADVVSAGLVHRTLGLPFDWTVLQQGGGVLLTVLIGTVLVSPDRRRRVFGLLWLGAGTHLLADLLIRTPDGHAQSILWPLTQYQPPAVGLYTSVDRWPLVLAAVVALATWYLIRRPNTERVFSGGVRSGGNSTDQSRK